METNKILNADILDIIFEGRNKQYGAYDLRKTYNRRLARALSVMLGICLVAIAGGVLANNSSGKKPQMLTGGEITLQALPDAPPPVVPPPPKVQPKLEVIKFTEPVITTKEVVAPPPQVDLDDANISNFDQKGIKEIALTAPVEPIGTGKVEAPVNEPNFTKEFITVQKFAQFPGGMEAWAKYLQHSLRESVPVDNGAPAGDYKVVVSFLVDRDGNITQVKAENDPGYGVAAEAVRVIERSGKWVPANQNGRPVIYRQKQQITFQIADN